MASRCEWNSGITVKFTRSRPSKRSIEARQKDIFHFTDYVSQGNIVRKPEFIARIHKVPISEHLNIFFIAYLFL